MFSIFFALITLISSERGATMCITWGPQSAIFLTWSLQNFSTNIGSRKAEVAKNYCTYILVLCGSFSLILGYIIFRCDHNWLIIASWLCRGKYYKMATKVELDKFLTAPNSFVSPNAPHYLPAKELLPKKKSYGDVRALFPQQIELQCFCPVAYVDGNYRYNQGLIDYRSNSNIISLYT